ncbi:MAG: bifunctional phosphoribosylaminoimidazolecarboxamide formyltransferase/IMP cyclohydrolase [Candidatus Marinimicrobia bacterium]|nr:bifunctional phosphoribosylaminoimidazolecarboxamide formyltransferase/IMP cyclohydrolase [Candidatus Neomarinimicrobiota bacterium]
MSDKVRIKRAVISVSDKTGVEQLASKLQAMGVEIISTGGTLKKLKEAGIQAISASTFTGAPEIMGGRVKTLHPKMYAGILCRRDNPSDMEQLSEHDYRSIELVVVNLYPFEQMLAKGLTRQEMVEYIDIGGPSLLRAAAKNYRHVLVLSEPGQYAAFQEAYTAHQGDIPEGSRQKYAEHVFSVTARYDSLIADYFTGKDNQLSISATLQQSLRYGENPHQAAAFYLPAGASPPWKQLHGKELSFNNFADIEAACLIVREFEEPAVAIIKHANPCGFAVGATAAEAYRRALTTDPISSFGGIVAFNREVDKETAEALAELFLECIIAPSFSAEALERLMRKKNLRLLQLLDNDPDRGLDIRSVAGGFLVQDRDTFQSEDHWEVATSEKPAKDVMQAIRLGWKLVRFVKSNAIVFCNYVQLLGVGAGQMSRIDAVELAGIKAGKAQLSLEGAVMASDAFFPFPDSIEAAARLGIRGIIQPGGSRRDNEVISAAEKSGIPMILTHTRHFRH